MRMLGIDPGRHGALACIDSARGSLCVFAMPVRQEKRSRTVKTFVDETRLCHLIKTLTPDHAVIEDVFAIVNEGHRENPRAAFSFGLGKGVLIGALAGLGVNTAFVSPSLWKRDLKVPANKQASKQRSHQLFPACIPILTSEGKAEAAMIALHGILSFGVALQPLTPSCLSF